MAIEMTESDRIVSLDFGGGNPTNMTFEPIRPGEDPGSIEVDMTKPENYVFEKRLKQDVIPGARFLPIPTHKYIVKKFFLVFSGIYNGIKSYQNSITIAFSLSYLFMFGPNFIKAFVNYLSSNSTNGDLFLFSQASSKVLFPERVPDEEEHQYT